MESLDDVVNGDDEEDDDDEDDDEIVFWGFTETERRFSFLESAFGDEEEGEEGVDTTADGAAFAATPPATTPGDADFALTYLPDAVADFTSPPFSCSSLSASSV